MRNRYNFALSDVHSVSCVRRIAHILVYDAFSIGKGVFLFENDAKWCFCAFLEKAELMSAVRHQPSIV